ncbi:S66 peptidase family protein [Qipengyuania atrilutea]|uniref:LD-carboxypeptidase n=1 Tax=Qipengyuania atrilutea TaxID=2744473 RepID=A0A850GYU6_9SPHN|nr:LD-carboxypeptidase [Actirhodobacter atriluteus]NVD44824.1 LD-carboxypeptidase [Actirhodobacter atriluteus]
MLSRRAVLEGAGGALAAASLAGPLAAASTCKPERLRLGDTVGLVAPAGTLETPDQLSIAEHWIRGMGLIPKVGRHVSDTYGYLAGTDAERAADLNAMFADDAVSGIFAVRGGWGGARILELLDWETICANPKLFIGFSDNTALHLAIAERAGFPTIHGPNAASSWPRTSWESLWRLAFTGEMPTLGGGDAGRSITGGTARGRLLGGNLTIISTLMGTPWMPDLSGAILFLEDIDEAEYRIDRMLTQLRLAGVLERLSGIVFGQCTDCRSPTAETSGFTLNEVLDQHLRPLGIPAFTGANIGHVSGQVCLPSGVRAELDADARTITMLEPTVA